MKGYPLISKVLRKWLSWGYGSEQLGQVTEEGQSFKDFILSGESTMSVPDTGRQYKSYFYLWVEIVNKHVVRE